MTEPGTAARLLRRLCLAAAALGGLVLLAVAGTVTLSVVMREFAGAGIRGDFELVELACVVSAFLFLPICQLERRHVQVDIFSARLPARVRSGLDRCWELLFVAAWAAIGLRMLYGAVEAYGTAQATMLLRIPDWLVYIPAMAGVVLSLLAALLNTVARTQPGEPTK